MKQLRSGNGAPWQRWLGGLAPRELLLRSWRNGREHDVQGQAARLAFFFVLALFPLLLLLMTLLGLALESASVPEAALQRLLSTIAPASASALVDATLREVRHAWSPGRLWFALIVMVWSASQGMRAAILALNVAYGVRQARSWLRRQAVSALLTVAMLLLLAATLMLLLYGRRYSAALSDAGFSTVASLCRSPAGSSSSRSRSRHSTRFTAGRRTCRGRPGTGSCRARSAASCSGCSPRWVCSCTFVTSTG